MCLTHNTMKRYIHTYNFSIDDQLFIIEAYEIIWKNLDHSRLYCINIEALAYEILKHCGKVSENVWMQKRKFSNDKMTQYEKTFIILMSALDKK